MKSSKLLILLTALALTACNPNENSSKEGGYSGTDSDCLPKNSEISSISFSSNDYVSIGTSSSVEASSSEQQSSSSEVSTTVSSSEVKSSSEAVSSSSAAQSSSAAVSSSSVASSSSQEQSSSAAANSSEQELGYKVNFVNPSCGTMSTEVLNDRLKAYINETVGFNLVSSVTNSKCQINTGYPTEGNSILIIGSSKVAGSLAFTFTSNVQMIKITAQTYHKPYTQNGVEYPNVDANSVLRITAGSTNELDLTPVDGQPVEKTYSEAIQKSNLTLASKNDDKGRVFIKDITFIL